MEGVRVVLIGAGNVATHLARAINRHNHIIQVYSKHIDNARTLAAQLCDCEPTNDVSEIATDADIYVISIKDDAIRNVSDTMPDIGDGIVVHTSGSVPIETLSRHRNYGVLYPLQTFTKDAAVDISQVPFFIEASNEKTRAFIDEFARTLSRTVMLADSEQRATLHIAAVFGCNFVNHLLSISSALLADDGYSLDVLRPLLGVTIDKAMRIGPDRSQTGPAMRNDTAVISKHLSRLDGYDKDIYTILTHSIINKYSKN